jgi:hypothetical protein
MPVRRECDGRWRYRKIVKLPNGQKVRISGTPTLNTKLAAEAAERDEINRRISPPAAIEKKKEVPTFQYRRRAEGPGSFKRETWVKLREKG